MNLLSGVEQDFHRPQTSPGGYEWWHFDGIDDNAGLSFSAQFYAGHLLSPYYQENLTAYWKGSQSPLVSEKQPVPPHPLDHCGVIFRVFHKGGRSEEFFQEFDPGMLKASDQAPAVLLGGNRFNWLPDGNPASYTLTLQGPIQDGLSLRARLFFTPEKIRMPALTPSEDWPTHTWVLAAPDCHVEGTLEWCDKEGDVKKEIAFLGRGYHDHHFGSVPPGQFVKAWYWGRAFLGEKTLVYSLQIPADGKEAPWGHFFSLSKGDAQHWKVSYQLSKGRHNFFWLPYFKKMGFTDAHRFEVEHSTLLSDGPFSITFGDRVTWEGDGKELEGPGLTSYLYLPRLGNRFFAPMMKGKTQRVTRPKAVAVPPPTGDVTTDRPDISPK